MIWILIQMKPLSMVESSAHQLPNQLLSVNYYITLLDYIILCR